ncbi:AraC family transcriptional regulator [Corynebacterium glutamicum]|nr:AraC family transcriptional regulator [Corynebacterium glutamicum]
MTVSREELSLPSRTLNNAFRQYFPSPGAGSVLTQLIESSIFNNVVTRESSEFLGHAAIDLLAGLVYEKATPYAPDEALRVAVHGYIRENLGSLQLTAASVAKAHRISVRTLHRLFEGEEYGVAELIRHLRLEAVHEDLRDPRLQNLTILAIGMRHGISSQAHLTRLFRAKYGVPPAEFRRGCINSAA